MATKFTAVILSCLLATTVLLGCASGPPKELLERQDHAGLAAWYEKEAAHLRSRAEAMRVMGQRYEKLSYRPQPKVDMVAHCRQLVESFTKAAEQAEALAKIHREQAGS